MTEATGTAILVGGVGQRPETEGQAMILTLEDALLDRPTICAILLSALEALAVWEAETGRLILLDGHNRFALCHTRLWRQK